MSDTFFVPNGINGSNGEYLLQPPTPHEILEISLGNRLPKEFLTQLQDRNDRNVETYGVPFGIEPDNLSQTGWAVLFPSDIHPQIIQALRPLLDLRKTQAGALYREFQNGEGYLPGDTANRWLARAPRSKGPGVCTCEKVPYYLLIVGSPGQIPFRFQYELSINYAVGRIHFDELECYRNFAHNVVRAEEALSSARRALFLDREPRRCRHPIKRRQVSSAVVRLSRTPRLADRHLRGRLRHERNTQIATLSQWPASGAFVHCQSRDGVCIGRSPPATSPRRPALPGLVGALGS